MSTDFNPQLYESWTSTTTTAVPDSVSQDPVVDLTTTTPAASYDFPFTPLSSTTAAPSVPIPTIDQLTKGHGRIEEIDGQKYLLGLRGRITVYDAEHLLVVSNGAHMAQELRSVLQYPWQALDDVQTVISMQDFGRAKRAIHMKRNVSDAVRERRRERIRAYWERRKAQQNLQIPPAG